LCTKFVFVSVNYVRNKYLVYRSRFVKEESDLKNTHTFTKLNPQYFRIRYIYLHNLSRFVERSKDR